jgi:hypothetical protein
MSSTIAVQDLRVGMFVQLDGGWLSHPFPLSNFKIGSAEQIRTIRGLGLKQVRWVPEKSDLEPEADSRAAGPVPARPPSRSAPPRRAARPWPRSANASSTTSASTPKPPPPGARPSTP